MSSNKPYPSSVAVARLAGVSQSAVSRTFTPGASVSPETRAKVLAAAQELGFRPSLIPQIMLTGQSDIVAIVVGGLENGFYGRVLETFARRLRDAGKEILLIPVESDYKLDAVAARLSQYRVDAIVSALAVLSQEIADALSEFQIPIVSFNTPIVGRWVSSVSSDNVAAGRLAAKLLYTCGGRHFAFVSGPVESPASLDRFKGFQQSLTKLKASPPVIVEGDYTYAGGAKAAEYLFENSPHTDAVFCANDLAAIGLMDVARRRFSYRVPDELMIIGYDDNVSASWGSYDLTTFDQNVSALVDAAIHLIQKPAIDNPSNGQLIRIPPILRERGTTRS